MRTFHLDGRDSCSSNRVTVPRSRLAENPHPVPNTWRAAIMHRTVLPQSGAISNFSAGCTFPTRKSTQRKSSLRSIDSGRHRRLALGFHASRRPPCCLRGQLSGHIPSVGASALEKEREREGRQARRSRARSPRELNLVPSRKGERATERPTRAWRKTRRRWAAC